MKAQFHRLTLWVIIFPLTAIFVFSAPSQAQDKYPSRPINVVVGYGAGGSTDSFARGLVESAKDVFKIPMPILNKPGAGSAIAAEFVKLAKPDGYTISVITTAAQNQVRLGHANYDFFKDFTHIAHICRWIIGLTVSASSPWKNFQEFRDYARAHPGEIKFVAAPGAQGQLTSENLALEAGIKWKLFPSTSDTENVAALLGGNVQASSGGWLSFGEHVKAGKMRLLVVFAEERMPEFPDVPTAKDLGLNVGIKGPLGVVGPKGLSPNIVKILADGFKKATEDPKFINFMANVMHTPILYKGPEEYLREAQEYDEWAVKIMKAIGMIQ